MNDKRYAEIMRLCTHLREKLARQEKTLLELERILAVQRLCPEFCAGARALSWGWHDVGGRTIADGPWEFTVRSQGEWRTFPLLAVPAVLREQPQQEWARKRESRRSALRGVFS